MHSLFSRALVALVITVSAVRAEPGVVVSLASVGDRVRAQNPDLAAARLRIREALGRMNQSGRLSNPEIETQVSHDPRYRERSLEIGFVQRFPLTNRLRLEKSVTLAEYKASEAEVREVERQIIAEAREGVVSVLAIRQRRELLDQQSALAKELSDFLSGIAEKGEGSKLDAGQAKLEAAGIALEMRQLDATEAAAIGTLKPLLGMLPAQKLLVSGSLPAPAIPVADVNHARRPDYQAAILQADAAAKGVELEQAKRYDDVEAGIFAGAERTEDAPDGYDKEAMVGLRFTFPLPLWNKNEGAIEEAQALKERRDKEANALARSIHLEAEAARSEMQQWTKLLDELGGTLIPLAEEQAKAAEDAFRQGQGELQTVFRTREKRLQLAAARLDALQQFHLARVRHEAAAGKP
ncbi:TolC family protein [Luteolibacter flavescens]|uniref:TolC family protein n=1 Tax=Luteolibacter flavescens TaxID=1859460 RepID=A0ABT3FT39_9BACT|nr:TolC family protein [Luteolibacter flavescens]MCW1886751.1 TolC family protein [Luteolibacter flavescens]